MKKRFPVKTKSQFFDVIELKSGVFTVQLHQSAFAGANNGFIQLDEEIVLFDTFSNPKVTQILLHEIKKLLGDYPSLVVNSHFHTDHILGNGIIPPMIPILSGAITRTKIQEGTLPRIMGWQKEAKQQIRDIKKKIQYEQNLEVKLELQADLEFYLFIISPSFKFRLPNFLISNNLTIYGKDRRIIVHNVGKCHSPEDIYAYLPEDKICFIGDLIFNNLEEIDIKNAVMPFSCDPQHHLEILEGLLDLPIDIIVPGHGPITNKDGIKKNINFINANLL